VKHATRVQILAVVAVLAVAGAACSSSSKSSKVSSPSPTAGSSSTVAAPTGTPVGLGLVTPDTGAGNLKPEGDGFEAFVAYANAELGGFGGRPGSVVRCDYANDAGKVADCARKAADDKGQIAATGAGRFADVIVNAVGAASDPMPYVCPALNRPAEGTATNAFCLYAGSPMGYFASLSYMKTKGYKTGYLTTADSDAGHATGSIVDRMAKALGMTIKASYYATAQSDFLPVAQAAVAAKPDFVLVGAGVPQELSMVQAFVTLGSTIPMGTWAPLLPQSSLDQVKSAKFPIVFDSVVPDGAKSTDPEVVKYRDWMNKKGFGADEIGDISLEGWLAGRVIQDATNQLKAGGKDLTRANLLSLLRTGEIKVPLLPPLSLAKAPKQTPGYASVANPTVKVGTFENGQRQILDLTATLP
jgi:branched-chain amino acid transport system substrate-binding protein